MPSKNRKSSAEGDSTDDHSFEQAVAELEAIVEQMESEQLPLNELIDQYEKGVRLFSACNKLLGEARERLELITLKAREQTDSTTAQSARSSTTGEGESEEDDIRLF